MHKEHKEFNEAVFKDLCRRAIEDLPEEVKHSQAKWEQKQVMVLEHLLAKVRDFCGVEEGFKFDDLTGFPRSMHIKQEIIGIVDFDSIHEHTSGVFFRKQPIIEDYVKRAIGGESE